MDIFTEIKETLRLKVLEEYTTQELLAEIQRRQEMARQGIFQEHWVDENGNPAGGVATGKGITISYQNGPLGKIGTPERKEPNGAFVEDVIAAAKGRFEFYQEASDGKFACEENAECIALCERILEIQVSRTKRRTEAGVEGTHERN